MNSSKLSGAGSARLTTGHLSVAALALVLSLGTTSGCSSDPGEPGDADAGPVEENAPYEDADWLFSPDTLLDIEVDISEGDWDALRFQNRTILDIFGETCGSAPAGSPFTYVPATVTVNGEVMENVGIRKKGFLGSLDNDKPSLKIKFDKYVDGQRLTGLERMTLNNSKQDLSYMNQCLGYQLFARAGVPAPRCNFARVAVNGRPMGIFVHVESVKKAFLGQYFDDNDGNLYEGTLSDFRPGWTATFERKTNESEPPGSEDRSDIQAVADALELEDAAMLAELESLIDLDGFYSFWAVEAMTSHWDGYGGNNNNFFIYGDPTTGKFTFMPWGADQLFGDPTGGPVLTRSLMTRRLYDYDVSRERYLARYQELVEEVWNDGDALVEINRIEALISPYFTAEQELAFDEGVAGLRAAIDGRQQRMAQALAEAGANDAQPVGDPLCFVQSGSVQASFTAVWNGGAGSAATLAVDLHGESLSLDNINVFTGPDEESPGRSVIFLVGETNDNRTVIAFVNTPDEYFAPGTIAVASAESSAEAAILLFQTGAEEPDEVYFMSGSLVLDEASPTEGAAVVGSFDLAAWDPPWF